MCASPLSPVSPVSPLVLQRRCVLAALRTSADREAMRSVEAEVWAHLGVAMQRLGETENSGTKKWMGRPLVVAFSCEKWPKKHEQTMVKR